MLRAFISHSIYLNILGGLFMCQRSQILLKMVTVLFPDYFCYHSNGKHQISTTLLHLGYCSNKVIRINW